VILSCEVTFSRTSARIELFPAIAEETLHQRSFGGHGLKEGFPDPDEAGALTAGMKQVSVSPGKRGKKNPWAAFQILAKNRIIYSKATRSEGGEIFL